MEQKEYELIKEIHERITRLEKNFRENIEKRQNGRDYGVR